MIRTWTLRAKLLILGLSFPSLLVGALLVTYVWHEQERAVDKLVTKARAICMTAEATRESMEDKWSKGLFSADLLKSLAADPDKERARSRILETVPVFSALVAAGKKAEECGYSFKVPKNHPGGKTGQA